MKTMASTRITVDDGAVDEQQHRKDHADGHHRDQPDAVVARVLLIRGERRGTGDVGLETWWRAGEFADDVPDRIDGLVRQAFALVAGQVQLKRKRPCCRRFGIPPP